MGTKRRGRRLSSTEARHFLFLCMRCESVLFALRCFIEDQLARIESHLHMASAEFDEWRQLTSRQRQTKSAAIRRRQVAELRRALKQQKTIRERARMTQLKRVRAQHGTAGAFVRFLDQLRPVVERRWKRDTVKVRRIERELRRSKYATTAQHLRRLRQRVAALQEQHRWCSWVAEDFRSRHRPRLERLYSSVEEVRRKFRETPI